MGLLQRSVEPLLRHTCSHCPFNQQRADQLDRLQRLAEGDRDADDSELQAPYAEAVATVGDHQKATTAELLRIGEEKIQPETAAYLLVNETSATFSVFPLHADSSANRRTGGGAPRSVVGFPEFSFPLLTAADGRHSLVLGRLPSHARVR